MDGEQDRAVCLMAGGPVVHSPVVGRRIRMRVGRGLGVLMRVRPMGIVIAFLATAVANLKRERAHCGNSRDPTDDRVRVQLRSFDSMQDRYAALHHQGPLRLP